jgi:hypothetical protein
MKSDTPRTDAEYRFKAEVSENPCPPNEHSEWMTSLCRELERENTRLRNLLANIGIDKPNPTGK